MMTNLVRRLITNLRYPLQVVGDNGRAFEQQAFDTVLPWSDEDEDLLEDWDECGYLTGYDLYSLDDDNCSFHLWEEDDDIMGWSEEDVF